MNMQTDLFDDDCLQRVKQTLNNTETPEFLQSDCSILNCPITYEEVVKSRLHKASVINIPAESGSSLNETCVYLLLENKSCICERKDT